jgi:hypothetical protein
VDAGGRLFDVRRRGHKLLAARGLGEVHLTGAARLPALAALAPHLRRRAGRQARAGQKQARD